MLKFLGQKIFVIFSGYLKGSELVVRPKRILHVVGAMNRGGAETMLMNMYRALDKERVQFDFLEFKPGTSDYSEEIQSLGGRILRVNWSQSPIRLHQTIQEVARVISDEGPFAAVHSHVLFATGTVLVAAARAGVEVRVAHSHNTDDVDQGKIADVYRWFARRMIRTSATHLAACTSDAGKYLFGERRFNEGGVVIPNAVDIKQFRPATPEERLKQTRALGLDPDRLNIVSVARMEMAKNHSFLLDVAAELKKRNVNFDMILVGKGSLRPVLEKQVLDKGLHHRVHFWGTRENISEIMQCSDVFVMPSHFEGLPVALVEAQATGLPCLVSDNVTKEVDMGLGLVKHLPTESALVWADALSETLPDNPGSYAIRQYLKSRGYTVEGSLEKLLELYPPVLPD